MSNSKAHTILGVRGTLEQIERSDNLYVKQVWKARRDRGNDAVIVTVRFDDQCRNGHMDFSITGTHYEKGQHSSSGCIHEIVAEWFPELAPFIKFHLVGTNQPMHYVANTVYHAREHGPTYAWVYYKGAKASDPLGIGYDSVKERLLGYEKAHVARKAEGVEGYRVQWDEKTAKTRNLEHARSSAVWPDATDEQLSVSEAELIAALTARLPALMAEFRTAMVDTFGFEWREVK